MENTTKTTCQTCFRTQVEPGAKPQTQWTSVCRCDRPYLPSSNFSIDVCAKCKRRVVAIVDGDVTRQDLCTCQNPDPKKVPTYIKPNEFDPLTLELSNARLSPDIFPIEKYTPISMLGFSEGATVVLARDKKRGTKVAVKIFKKIPPTMQPTFQSEIKKNQQLTHTNIAKVVDFGFYQDKTPYLVTEYKDGFNIEQLLELYGTPSYDVAIKILLGICETLIYTQKQGVLHRDIRPGNVIFLDDMNSEPSVSITDFALPKIKASQPLTDPLDAIYMSCEEARGLDYSEKSEIYAIGCIGFALITGRPPFQGSSALDIKNMHALKLPPRISSLKFDAERPTELDEIIERCLEKDPNNRFETLAKLSERLEVFPRREKMKIEAVLATKKRKTVLTIAAAGGLILTVMIVGIYLATHLH
jgi:serine/threonine protein kinase